MLPSDFSNSVHSEVAIFLPFLVVCCLLQLSGRTFFEFAVVKNPTFAVRILIMSAVVPAVINISGCSVIVRVCCGHCLEANYSQQLQICCWNLDAVSHIFRDISISDFDGHIAISKRPCNKLVQYYYCCFMVWFNWSTFLDLTSS